jgi:hypothetical protein
MNATEVVVVKPQEVTSPDSESSPSDAHIIETDVASKDLRAAATVADADTKAPETATVTTTLEVRPASASKETPTTTEPGMVRLTSHSSSQGPRSDAGEQEEVKRPSGRASQTRRVSEYPGRIELEKPKQKSLSQRLKASKFYHGDAATKTRACLNGRTFVLIMSVALLIALFLPEIWVLAGTNSNIEIDTILTIVMIMFTFEFFALSLLDATYFLSFFFLMDIVGTISMIFDISYLVGTDNTKVQTYQGGDSSAQKNLMLLRAARAARVGARAGRLSKVLKILRFLPFLAQSKEDASTGISASISKQLANLLATRVAALTIILVMVIPAFDILSFPQNDHSLQTWAERLSANLAENTALGNTAFQNELVELLAFYKKRTYGPYIACRGTPSGDDSWKCTETFTAAYQHEAPARAASALWVHTDTFMVGFNMHQPQQLDKGLAIVMIWFIIGIMIFSGLALSNVVTELAVRPLERMLKTVREIAETVFNMQKSAAVEEEQEDDNEEIDINSSSEMKLLEKVVQKLAIIADLQADKPRDVADMGEEELGILSLMQGKDVALDSKKQAQRKTMTTGFPKGKKLSLADTTNLEETGVSAEVYNSYDFNTLTITKEQMTTIGIYAVSRFHDDGEGFISTPEDKATLRRFVIEAEKQYPPNPFHNFSHATDVLHGASKMMRMINSHLFFTELEQFCLLVGAIGHDIGHPGVNNPFLLEVGHELALQYNDLSPLENMHVSKLYSILMNPETNVFSMLTKEQYKEVRKLSIETILHTDMINHTAMVKELQMVFQMNSEIFSNGTTGDPETEIFSSPDTKLLIMENILHSADVSNPARSWDVSYAWAQCVLEEFFCQGDQEKLLGVPVGMLNDRNTLNRPNSQIGFLEFMIAPFFAAQIQLFHKLHPYGDNLSSNLVRWEELWVQEVQPADEQRAKVHARVEGVQNKLEAAKQVSKPIGEEVEGVTVAGEP